MGLQCRASERGQPRPRWVRYLLADRHSTGIREGAEPIEAAHAWVCSSSLTARERDEERPQSSPAPPLQVTVVPLGSDVFGYELSVEFCL